jgi:hypothetical protein
LTQTDIQGLRASPYLLAASPGASFWLLPVHYSVEWFPNGVGATGGGNLDMQYTNGVVTIVAGVMNSTSMASSSAKFTRGNSIVAVGNDGNLLNNQGIRLKNVGSAEWACHTGSQMQIRIGYLTIPYI